MSRTMMLPVRCNIATAASAHDAHPGITTRTARQSRRGWIARDTRTTADVVCARKKCVEIRSIPTPFPPPILKPNGEKAKENNLVI